MDAGVAFADLADVTSKEEPMMMSVTLSFVLLLPGLPANDQEVEDAACGKSTSTIAFTSGRDDPGGVPQLAAEIYLMDPDGTNPRRLTENADGDGFPALSPDGKGRIVFDSNRARGADEPLNTSDLFLMKKDGTHQRRLTRGSSAAWSPDGKRIAFHRSASGTGLPIKPDPGAATTDSDIFVARVGALLAEWDGEDDDEGDESDDGPTNLTNSADFIDDDPNWSPDGQKIVYTRHGVNDNHVNSSTAEIYVINADGTGEPERLTDNVEEERGPAWSPDGTRIVFSCRRGGPDFEICVMNADGKDQVQLTSNSVPDLTASWSPDGQKILFHRFVAGQGLQLFVMNANGSGPPTQLTQPPGMNLLASWGCVKFRGDEQD
jgi:TolB protein